MKVTCCKLFKDCLMHFFKCVIKVLPYLIPVLTAILIYAVWNLRYDYFDIDEQSKGAMDAWLYLVTGAATIVLAAIAYLKIGEINEDNETRLLLNIDRQWNSKMMVEARTIIHNLYIKNGGDRIDSTKESAPKIEEVCEKMGKDIIKMSKSPQPKLQTKFVLLLNYLDFMETIGYLNAKSRGVKHQKLDALCGETLKFNYMVFEKYIKHKRKKHKKKPYYKYFEKLDGKLKDTE